MGKNRHSKDRLFITQTEHKYLYGGKKAEIKRAYRRASLLCCCCRALWSLTNLLFACRTAVQLLRHHALPVLRESALPLTGPLNLYPYAG